MSFFWLIKFFLPIIFKWSRTNLVSMSIDQQFDNIFRPLSSGQRGEVYEVNGDRVAVILDAGENKTDEGKKDEKPVEESVKPSVYWIHGIFCLA